MPSVVGQQQHDTGLPLGRRALMPRSASLASVSVAPFDGIKVRVIVQSGGSRMTAIRWHTRADYLHRQPRQVTQRLELSGELEHLLRTSHRGANMDVDMRRDAIWFAIWIAVAVAVVLGGAGFGIAYLLWR